MPIPEPGGILWPQVKIRMSNKWPTTVEEQMDRLGQAWTTVGDLYVSEGEPRGNEPPKEAWGDPTGDQFRAKIDQLRNNSVKRTGVKMQGLGQNATLFGSDVKYTKESIKTEIDGLLWTYVLLLISEAAAGAGGPRRGGGGGGTGGGATEAWLELVAKSVDEFIQQMAARVGGRGRNEKGLPRPEFAGTEPGYTPPSGQPDPNATPRGTKTDVPDLLPDGRNADEVRGLDRENESADILAKQGLDVEQNPEPRPNGKKPDYLIEGKYFDNVAPGRETDVNGIHQRIVDKVGNGPDKIQADRIVVNLGDSGVDPQTVRDDLQNNRIEGLKEVLGVDKNGNVVRLYP